jgi:hypothetical protein
VVMGMGGGWFGGFVGGLGLVVVFVGVVGVSVVWVVVVWGLVGGVCGVVWCGCGCGGGCGGCGRGWVCGVG